MSGIAAAHGPFDPARGRRMLDRLTHRGPDGAGEVSCDGAWLGSRYLSIVDPERGDQPVTGGADRGLALVGDGTVHNHRRLRERLGTDRFRTESDLEAALLLFDDLGTEAFEQLWGPFALVLAAEDGRFAVGRDVLGLAPLYWVRTEADDGATTVFASELKAFDVDDRPRVEPFPPGHAWTPQDGLIPIRGFPGTAPVLLQSRSPEEDPPAWVFDAVRDTLIRAVARSLEAPQPVGILLSGGVDSSIVTAIAAHLLPEGQTLRTFAAGLEGSRDLEAARLVAEHCGTEHQELVYTAEDAVDLVPKVIARLESFDPTLVHSTVPNFFVSQLAAQQAKIVLVGEGADELFAGYTHFGRHEAGDALHSELIETMQGMHIGGLQRVDRVAGALGVEPHLPFLDLDMVELAMALPPEWKLVTEERPAKWLLRRAFDGWLPDEVLWRRKEQFGQGTGMDDVLRAHYEEAVSAEEFDAEAGVIRPPLRTREELAYFRMFSEALSGVDPEITVGRFAEA
ncbi:MAG: asparagine synthase-related protein [Nesterenkonia sp.]|nr:asparagine synthase-related protein [Nesterenkonia sp.]